MAKSARTVVVTGTPGVPVPPDAVPAECARCRGSQMIARSTAWALEDAPAAVLLCWSCLQSLLHKENAPGPIAVVGIREGRRRGLFPDPGAL